MRKNLLFVISVILLISCSDDDSFERGNWVERSVFDGVPRSNVASFVIGNYGYMGTGYDGDEYLSDFWQYDIEGDYWVQKADFPGTPRSAATGFTINNLGYLGTGYDGDNELSDFWQYNPDTNSWEQKADFGGGIRRGTVSFSYGNYGYIGTGYDGDNDKKDFWKYDATEGSWIELVGFGGDKRRDAAAFQIDDKIYVGTGVSNGLYQEDFWMFDPESENWTRLNDLDEEDDYNIVRSNATAFSVNGMGYIACGYQYGALTSVWEYDPSTDSWEEITDIEATSRQDPTSFSNGTRAFVLLGRSGSLYLDDSYEVYPNEEYNDED